MQKTTVQYFCDLCGKETRAGSMLDVKFMFGGWRCCAKRDQNEVVKVLTGEICDECRDELLKKFEKLRLQMTKRGCISMEPLEADFKPDPLPKASSPE